MVVHFDPAWLRELADSVILPGAGRELGDDLRSLHEQIYDMPEERRAESLSSLHAYAFVRSGLRDLVLTGVAEYGRLPVSTCLVSQPVDQEATFLNPERTAALIRVRPERLRDRDRFTRWLRHELQRLADMLDPEFGYPVDGTPWPSGPYENLIRDRYALLWGMWTDARIERRCRAPWSSAADWCNAFDRVFGKIPDPWRRRTFEALRAGDTFSHSALLSFSLKPQEMVRRLAGGLPGDVRLPGAPCPLCLFPTFAWADPARVRAVADAVRTRRAEWTPDEGLCDRCAEYFDLVPVPAGGSR